MRRKIRGWIYIIIIIACLILLAASYISAATKRREQGRTNMSSDVVFGKEKE